MKVAILGSGNWGSTIAIKVGQNVIHHSEFDNDVRMWVYEEEVNGRKLTEIINTEHENVKYLPGFKIPENVRAVPDACATVADADVLIFVIPHQFVPRLLETIAPHIKPTAIAISLIKGYVEFPCGKKPLLGSEIISKRLGIDCGVLMGANVAVEVAREEFAEATLACRNLEVAKKLRLLFHCKTFAIRVVSDVPMVELCGGLKNIVATAAGFCDGLGFGGNTKAAILRMGLVEMARFVQKFYPDQKTDTLLFESCGVADLITTSFGGRNRKCAEAFARDPKRSWSDIEADLLGGQKLQGVSFLEEVWPVLLEHGNVAEEFPLFGRIHAICFEGMDVHKIVEY